MQSDFYTVERASGLIMPAVCQLSPNRDARPVGVEPELVVLHGISLPPAEFGGQEIVDFFCNRLDWNRHPYFETIRGLKVSAHLLIRRDGALLQLVPFSQRAWHAGVSRFRSRDCCNDFSIGIELEGTDDILYADVQYDILGKVLCALFAAYPKLTPRRLAAHSDIAPGRKTDPGPAFDWFRLYDCLGSDSASTGESPQT